MSSHNEFRITKIGAIKRSDDKVRLQIKEQYREALKNLDKFSHLIVLWWAHKHDNETSKSKMSTEPPYAKGHKMGVFATRAEYRPNPIAISTTKILNIDEENGIIEISNIDAIDDTPIIDLKAYFPVVDRVKNASIPEWLSDWPEWMPEDGIGLE